MTELKSECDVLADLRERVKQFGRQVKVANELGFTSAFLCDVLKGKRPVSPKLAEAMGYTRYVFFALNGKRKRQHSHSAK